ncbi:MAG: hypothetical protein V4819_12615 [Verrucomicrobiota bacterium]
MKPHHTLKWLTLLGTSTLLTVATATADPDKEKGNDKEKQNSAQVDNKDDDKARKNADKVDRKDDKADRQFEKKMEKADVRAEKREERQAYKKGEFKERLQDADRERVVTYFSGYKDNDHGLPPGLAKKWKDGKRLPNGWRDRVVTGYVIEDDWYPAFEPVPYDWFPNIAVVPDTRLYWYGDRVVRVYQPTREVVDVIIIPSVHIDL